MGLKKIRLNNYKKIIFISFVGAIIIFFLFTFFLNWLNLHKNLKTFNNSHYLFYIDKFFLEFSDGDLNLGFTFEINHVNPVAVGKGIWFTFVSSIQYVTNVFADILLNVLQNTIFLLFDGSVVYQSLNINYETYLKYLIISFFISFSIYLFLRFVFLTKNKNKIKNVSFLILNSTLLIVMIPMIFQLLFLFTRYLLEHVFNLDWDLLNIYDLINSASNNILTDNIFSNGIINLPEITFLIPPGISVSISGSFSKINWKLNSIETIQLFLTIFITWFIIYLCLKFCFRLALRIIEIFFFGFLAFPIVVAQSSKNGGENVIIWMSSLIKKILIPFLMLFIYIISITLTKQIINQDFNLGVYLPFDKEGFEELFSLLLLIFPFILIENFSKKWSYKMLKSEKKKINVELDEILDSKKLNLKILNNLNSYNNNLNSYNERNKILNSNNNISKLSSTKINNNSLEKKEKTINSTIDKIKNRKN